MNRSTIASGWSKATALFFAAKAAQIVKVSFMLGSYMMFFSLSNVVTPLSGAFAGLSGSIFTLILKLAWALFCTGSMVSFAYFANLLPGMFAGFYWASDSLLIRLFVPLLCMALFLVNPAGVSAWWYTLYWLIPVGLHFVSKQTLFSKALGSTFVAHAVGSVIWLYTVPMLTEQWAALMPIVLIERTLFALGMVGVYRVIDWATSYFYQLHSRFVQRAA